MKSGGISLNNSFNKNKPNRYNTITHIQFKDNPNFIIINKILMHLYDNDNYKELSLEENYKAIKELEKKYINTNNELFPIGSLKIILDGIKTIENELDDLGLDSLNFKKVSEIINKTVSPINKKFFKDSDTTSDIVQKERLIRKDITSLSLILALNRFKKFYKSSLLINSRVDMKYKFYNTKKDMLKLIESSDIHISSIAIQETMNKDKGITLFFTRELSIHLPLDNNFIKGVAYLIRNEKCGLSKDKYNDFKEELVKINPSYKYTF